MITMIGNHICKDCAAALEVIDRERLPIEFHDMNLTLDYVKEFLKVREGNEELFAECRKENQIGIPVFVLEDGTVTMDCEAAFEAARKKKRPAVVMVGTHLCSGCRATLEEIHEKGLTIEFHDIVENLNDTRLFLRIREGNRQIYDDIAAEGRVGIPVFLLPDGTVTLDKEQAFEAARKCQS